MLFQVSIRKEHCKELDMPTLLFDGVYSRLIFTAWLFCWCSLLFRWRGVCLLEYPQILLGRRFSYEDTSSLARFNKKIRFKGWLQPPRFRCLDEPDVTVQETESKLQYLIIKVTSSISYLDSTSRVLCFSSVLHTFL